VTPYTGSTSTNFTWTVTIFPQYVPSHNSTPLNVSLYVSNCPGATGPSPPPWCSAGFPFHQFTQTLPANLSKVTTLTFNYAIGSVGIWDWQMGVYTLNNSTQKPYYQTLIGDPTYNGIEGPVVGSFTTTYTELLPTIYFDDLLFLGGPFYLVLLVYVLFKNRERKRQDAQKRAAGAIPPTGSPSPSDAAPALQPPSTQPPPGGGTPPAAERTCPNCNAVVYANETKCWKCGADLTGGTGTPLPSRSS
jgi:hypothetical protein